MKRYAANRNIFAADIIDIFYRNIVKSHLQYSQKYFQITKKNIESFMFGLCRGDLPKIQRNYIHFRQLI